MQRIVFGNTDPCLRLFPIVGSDDDDSRVLRSRFDTPIVTGCRTKRIARARIARVASVLSRSMAMFLLLLTDKRDILGLTAEQLQLVPKIALLRNYADYVELLWDRLPDHLKTDPEVQSYRACHEHYNRPWQRTHIDGPPPLVRNCGVCRAALRQTH